MTESQNEPPALTEDQRGTYRQMLAESLRAAHRYRGDEASLNAIIETAGKLDRWLRDTFGTVTAEGPIDQKREEDIANLAGARKTKTISGILDVAHAQVSRVMQKSPTLEEALQKLHVVHNKIEGVLLPPGNQRPITGSGEGGWEKPKTEPRVQRLIAALQQHNIFTDDIIVTTGGLGQGMIRRERYALIEIPRIGREALVCNEVGEATFVSRRRLGLAVYLRYPKEELDQIEGVERIVSRGNGKWETDVIEALLRDISAGETRKIDVRDFDALRREIIRRVPTGEQWVKMTAKQKAKFEITGKKEASIATALGLNLERNPKSNPFAHALLGETVFGSDDPGIQKFLAQEREWIELERDPEKLRTKVKELCPTGKQWMEMTVRQKRQLEISGRGETVIASSLGLRLERDPKDNTYSHALLGEAVFGSDDPIIASIVKQLREQNAKREPLTSDWQDISRDPMMLKAKVRELCPTGEQWVSMTIRQKNKFKIAGRGEKAIATALGLKLEKDPKSNNYLHALLGEAVFGSDDPIIASIVKQLREQNAKREPLTSDWQDISRDPMMLKAKVRELCPTGEQWVSMTIRQRKKFKIAGRGEKAIATTLGLKFESDLRANAYLHAQLGEAIYGSDDPAIREALAKGKATNEGKR